MAKRRKRKRKSTWMSHVTNSAAVAFFLFIFGLRAASDNPHAAALFMAFGLVVFVWLKWLINHLQDRYKRWKRRNREVLEATPALLLALGAAGAAFWYAVAAYLTQIAVGVVVLVALVAAGVAASRRQDADRNRRRPSGRQQRAQVGNPQWRDPKPVYFGWQADQNDPNSPHAWKIGVANDVEKTWQGFDRGNAVGVHPVGSVTGGRPRESQLHDLMEEFRVPQAKGNRSREWFLDSQEVRQIIDELAAEAGVDNPHPARELAA